MTGLQLMTFATIGQFSVTFIIDSYPPAEKSDDIFITGNFNGWDPGRKDYQFEIKNGKQTLTIFLSPGNYEYKVTRGSWKNTEVKGDWTQLPNRIIDVQSDVTVNIKIAAWLDEKPATKQLSGNHTVTGRVHILDSAFYMPQLGRYRRIWIYLPKGYSKGRRRFPVLYMHDGQNVFDRATSFAGEWGVDEFLDTLCAGCRESIVVAIDNDSERRMNEYNPWQFQDYGRGEGDQYVDFLVKTLKPYIDSNYRTLKSKKYTAVAGSSMGGLISLYAVLKYPRIFGNAGIFSPAFWTAGGLNNFILAKSDKVKSNLFFYAGGKESDSMLPDMIQVENILKRLSDSEIKEIIDEEAGHNESAWRKHFSEFYEWVFCRGAKNRN